MNDEEQETRAKEEAETREEIEEETRLREAGGDDRKEEEAKVKIIEDGKINTEEREWLDSEAQEQRQNGTMDIRGSVQRGRYQGGWEHKGGEASDRKALFRPNQNL